MIYHLRAGSWDRYRKNFNELPDIIDQGIRGGHADALDALIYLVRNLVKTHNPYPEKWGWGDPNERFYNKSKANDDESFIKTIKKIMNMK